MVTDVDVGIAWWAYVLIVSGAGVIAWAIRAVLKLILDAYRSVQKGDMVPRITVDLMIKHYDERNDDLVAQYDARLAAKDAELDKVWTAYHLESSANQQIARSEVEQSNVTAQSVMALMESLQRARALPVVEVASGSNGSAGEHPGAASRAGSRSDA